MGGLGVWVGEMGVGREWGGWQWGARRAPSQQQAAWKAIRRNGLAKVITLSGVTYNWNTASFGRDLLTKEAGVIAQQIQEVLPEAVIVKDDGFLTVKYDRIIPLLIEAIKDLSAEIEILKKRIQ